MANYNTRDPAKAQLVSVANAIRIISLTLSGTYTSIRDLALAATKNLPNGIVLQVEVTPAANATYKEMWNQDTITILAGVTEIIPCSQAVDDLKFAGSGVAVFRIFLQE